MAGKAIKGDYCPLLKKKCIGLKCNWIVEIRGKNPNTGEDLNQWECAMVWLPTLLINTANETRQGAAATESFRNEMVRANKTNQEIMAQQVYATEDLKNEIIRIDESSKFLLSTTKTEQKLIDASKKPGD